MTLRHLVTPAFLLSCVLLGGASAAGHLGNLLLQLLAIVSIAFALATRGRGPMPAAGRQLMLLVILMAGFLVLQLVPLPPQLWTHLPGRGSIADGYRLLGQPMPWLPISLAPDDTLAALLWVLPSIAIILLIVRLGAFKGELIAWTLGVAAVLSVVVGALQVAGGPSSPWYLYSITNRGVAVGFFANTNHLATLLLMAIPFQVALQARRLSRKQSLRRASGTIVVTTSILVLIVVGLLLSTSIAGLGLAVPVIGTSLLMVGRHRTTRIRWASFGLAAAALATVALLLWSPMSSTLGANSFSASAGSRQESTRVTLEAAGDHFPLGSGIGSFAEVYRLFEDPDGISSTYMNHAHSDYVEIALEGGLPALILLVLFLLWWGARAAEIWRSREPDHIGQAAVIASAAVLLHSLVDYPLRTAAVAALFAACCALMAQPRPLARQRSSTSQETEARHLSAD